MSTPTRSSKRSNSSIERSAILTFSSSANCARTPPADLLVEPAPGASRSTRTTSVMPSSARCQTVLAPIAPPPMTTTSADSTATAGILPSERPRRRLGYAPPMHRLDILGVGRRLADEVGGYEVVHESPGLEVGVYVLVAPEPDKQQPHDDDEVYVVLDGSGVLNVEGE